MNSFVRETISFTSKNWIWIAITLVLFIIVVGISTKEGFSGIEDTMFGVSEYPQVFIDKVATPFLKENNFIKQFVAPTNEVRPVEIPSMVGNFPIDIGGGLAVKAMISVPAQTSAVPVNQTPVTLPTPVKTDTSVPSQTIQIPSQTVSIPGAVSEDKVVSMPVTIPAQIVTISAQQAHVPVTETFKSI